MPKDPSQNGKAKLKGKASEANRHEKRKSGVRVVNCSACGVVVGAGAIGVDFVMFDSRLLVDVAVVMTTGEVYRHIT